MDNSSYNVAPNARDVPPENGGGLPVGTMIHFGAATPPDGYLVCDGSTVSVGDYPDLFAAIGTTWGYGNGSSGTFTQTIADGGPSLRINFTTSTPTLFTAGKVFTVTGTYNGWVLKVVTAYSNYLFASGTFYGDPTNFPAYTDNAGGTAVLSNTTVFKVPNTSGKTIRGVAAVTYTLAATNGADSRVIAAANLPPHRHAAAAPGPININSSGTTPVSGYFFNFGTQYTGIASTYQEDGTTLVADTALDTTNVWVAIPMIIRAY